MLPILYYAILIPLLFYGLPATLLYLLTIKYYVDRLPASRRKSFFNSRRGKIVICFGSLIFVLLSWGLYVLLTEN